MDCRAVVQLQIPLISLSLTHHVQIVSNTPSAVTWSYKPPLRYLFYMLQDLANPSVLLISHLDAHLPEVAVAAVRLARFQTNQLTQRLFPQALRRGIKGTVIPPWVPSVGMTAVFKPLHPFCSKHSWNSASPCFTAGPHTLPWCLTAFLIPISRARPS